MNQRTLRLLGCVLPALVACGASSDDERASNSDLTVTPEGSSNDLIVTVTVPDEVLHKMVPVHFAHWQERVTMKFLTLRINAIDTVLVPGVPARVPYLPSSVLMIDFNNREETWDGRIWSESELKFTPGETRTIALGAMQLMTKLSTTRPTLDLGGFDPRQRLTRRMEDGRSVDVYRNFGDPWFAEVTNGPIVPAQPGHYQWWSAVTAPIDFDIEAGKVTVVEADVAAPFAKVVLHREPAAFPNAKELAPKLLCKNSRASAQTEVQFDVVSTVFTNDPAQCTLTGSLSVDNRWTGTAGPGANLEFNARRLDIDDVALTDRPGVKVPGTYALSVRIPGDHHGETKLVPLLSDVPTKTGLDLPPGQYRLVVDYKSPEGTVNQLARDIAL